MVKPAYYNAINEYTIVDEMPAGKGYADIIFIPRPFSDKPAMIIELKYNKSAEGAIAQITSVYGITPSGPLRLKRRNIEL